MYNQGLDTASQTITFMYCSVDIIKRFSMWLQEVTGGGHGSKRNCQD